MSGPMDPERLAAVKALAAAAKSEVGRWRPHALPGRIDVSVFVDGVHEETIICDAGSRTRAAMLSFDGGDLTEVLDDRDHWEAHAADIEDRLVECAERFAAAGLTGALRVVESAIAGRMSTHAAKARVVQLTERAETAEAEALKFRSRCILDEMAAQDTGAEVGQ